MKKLDDIEKKNIFEVPDRYFDRLALKIQSRTEVIKPSESFFGWRFALKYVLPSVVLTVATFFVLKPKSALEIDELLASVPTEHLIAYLHESDLSEPDLLDAVQLSTADADTLTLRVDEENLIEDISTSEVKRVLENEL